MPRFWAEIQIATTAEAAEAVGEILNAAGCQGAVYDDPEIYREGASLGDLIGDELRNRSGGEYKVIGYLPVDDGLQEKLAGIREQLSRAAGSLNIGSGEITLRRVAEENWAETWKAHFQPEIIGRIVIRPSWVPFEAERDQIVVDLDPGMAFGTGTHPSTRLSLELLQETIRPGNAVLDLGTGSGILAIAAAKLGASSVTAVDIDGVAVDVAKENAHRNGLAHIVRVQQGDLLTGLPPHAYDLAVANIIAAAILDLIPKIHIVLKPGGLFIAAGIVDARSGEVEAAFAGHGWKILQKAEAGEWRAYLAGR